MCVLSHEIRTTVLGRSSFRMRQREVKCPGCGVRGAPRKHLCSWASLPSWGSGSACVPRRRGSQGPWRGAVPTAENSWAEELGARAEARGTLPSLPPPPPQSSQLSCLVGRGRELQWRPREGTSLQPRGVLVPIKTNFLVHKSEGAESTPAFALGPLLLLSCKEPDPRFQTGLDPRASEGKFLSGLWLWQGSLVDECAPWGSSRRGQAQGLLSGSHTLSQFPWRRVRT